MNYTHDALYAYSKRCICSVINCLERPRLHINHIARKTVFSFSKCFEKMVFPKKLHWDMIYLVFSGKMIFVFPENMILFFRHKRKDDLSQKNTWKYDIFFKCSEKMVFPKKFAWTWSFLWYLERVYFFFPENLIYIFFRRKMKEDDPYQKTRGNTIISVYMCRR